MFLFIRITNDTEFRLTIMFTKHKYNRLFITKTVAMIIELRKDKIRGQCTL